MNIYPLDIPFHLFSTCILVRGHKRSCIYDLQRYDFEYIPNTLYDILYSSKNVTIQDIISLYDNIEDKNNIIEYFNFLFEKEFVFFSKMKSSFFPPLKIEFNKPYRVSTFIIDVDNSQLNYLEKIKENIINAKVECLVIRIINSNYNELIDILKKFDGIPTRIIQLFISKDVVILDSQIESLFDANNRTSVIIKTEDEIELTKEFKKGTFIWTKKDIINKKQKFIDISEFSPNLDLYMESKLFNSFYNKRVYIDSTGNICRFEIDSQNFGNLKLNRLEDILLNNDFTKYWNIKKDDIEICKDCEYRYMCVDSRLPLYQNNEKLWVLEGECNYDPYTSQWKKIV
ncbi:grasp-with-spasm system SPASM domain peptide maturase [Flavobacterium sp.]|uniref:grasp-with-spasm system SPASM domain peptide maturase n=1 Tax=Flavobacterium sp. TaxID=239 RepID=UPI00286DC28F|nr:grasp-with-spasm system SPASM domain peptide maturase [Flavobacterium sp.]